MSMSKTRVRQIFAKNMRKFRQERGLSQEKLAELCNLHRTYIGSVERGERNITIDNIERISIALGISIETLVSDKNL